MKKFILIIVIIVIVYLALVAILNLSGACPEYVDSMPRDPGTSSPSGPRAWHIFCPFIGEVW